MTNIFEEINGNKEKDAVDYLVSLGYVVIPPSKLENAYVRKPVDLVEYFYSLLLRYNPTRRVHYTKASRKDMRMAVLFVQSREKELGATRKNVIAECAEIVKCVVEHEEMFGFEAPLHSFDCFGQDKLKWVTDKAISIINREHEEVEREELQLFMDKLYCAQEKESIGSLGSKIKELRSILEDLDGREKENRR
jgi:hypothetical protein